MPNRDEEWVLACRQFESITAAEADQLMDIAPIMVRPEETLIEAVRKTVDQPSCRVLSVVDAGGKLLGLLPVSDLAFATLVHVMPETFLRHANDLRQSGQFAAMSHARTAGELMQAPRSLRPHDRLEDAFGQLLEVGLEGLPITDEAGRVVGYLNITEFLCAWMNNHPAPGREGEA